MKPQAELKIEMVPIDELVPYENNAKNHDSQQVDQIAESIEEFNFADPIACWHDKNGDSVIIEGHGRLMAAKKLGIEQLPVFYLDYLSDEQRRAYTLVHNKLTMNSDFDMSILQDELNRITSIDMNDFGFNFEEMSQDDSIDLWPEGERDDVFAKELGEMNNYIVLEFCTEDEWERAQKAFNLQRVSSHDKHPNVRRHGIGRVVEGKRVLEVMESVN